jgi:acetolactate synthase-1/2/3 large subunit
VAEITGSHLLAKALKSADVDSVFFLMGGPMTDVERHLAVHYDVRLIDVRHEQAAAMMAHSYSRVTGRPGICMTGAGVDAVNLITGLTNAFVDCCPVLAVCGSASLKDRGKGAFQEIDQMSLMKPITKAAWQVPSTFRIPAFVEMAFRHAVSGRPGPVYLEVPADVLNASIDETSAPLPELQKTNERAMGDSDAIKKAIRLLSASERPVVIAGSGVLWSGANKELQGFVETTGIPFYTTPQARGIIPEDHTMCFPGARSLAFREADCALVVGTRSNFIFGHFLHPRFSRDLKLIQVNIDATEIGHNKPADVGIAGDAGAVLTQLRDAADRDFDQARFSPWLERLRKRDHQKREEMLPMLNSEEKPIHPLRLCREIRDFLPRDAVFVVDGHETLNLARQTIPTYFPGHRINVGPAACIGVGVPFGIGAKVAKPDKPVVVFHGDGGFGMNGMEMDTAIRHNLPVIVIINNNGGWGPGLASPEVSGPEFGVVGRDLGLTRYDRVVEALGGWGAYVEEPDDIRPALEKAVAAGKPALVNVITDPEFITKTANFTDMMFL